LDPFTLAAGLSAIGSVFKGITGLIAGKREAQADKNAALQAEMEGGVNAQEALQSGNATAARAATQVAANGGGFVGSSLDVVKNLSEQAMFQARGQAYRARTVAQNDIYKAGVAKAQGLNQFVGSLINAGSSVAGGMMQQGLYQQQMLALKSLRGEGADSPYDYSF
jgi:hypothetical protein